MQHDPSQVPGGGQDALDRVMSGMSLFTLAMTVPQAVSVWTIAQATGVSRWSWGAYLLSAVTWLFYGLRKHDKHIWLPCVGWIVLDGAILAGLLINR